jgi:membrane-bound lytic murein transglycosylase D
MAAIRPLLLIALLLPALLCAQAGPDSSAVTLLADDPVVLRLDDLARVPWIKQSTFTTDTAHHNVHGFAPGVVPNWSDAVIAQRLATLDPTTPFALSFNPAVRAYVDLYVNRKREMSARMLGLAELYFPVFEQYLDRYDMPLELKYLAVVESALNPAARSRAGAVGLWQFMLPTGRIHGLKSDSYIDERHDLYKSTDAACRYLKHLHSIYDNWEMALAAYNCGPGNVNKAIRRSGGARDYWAIYEHLPRETRGYVPAFIAVNYVFAYHADHNIYPVAPSYCVHEVDTVQVCYPVDLALLARLTGANAEELRALNPTLKQGILPYAAKEPVSLYLPTEIAGTLVANEALLRERGITPTAGPGGADKADAARPDSTDTASIPQATRTEKRYHTVRRGESLGTIAQRHRTTVAQLKRLNNISGTTIRPGQKLVVGTRTVTVATAPPRTPPPGDAFIYHVVQPGDTLWDIAKRYPGVSVDDLKRLNEGVNELKVGDRIKVSRQDG